MENDIIEYIESLITSEETIIKKIDWQIIENDRKDNKSNANKSNKNGNYGEIEEASNNIDEGNTLQEGIVEMDKES